METVTCSCLKCKSLVGTYDNLWDKIGKTYYSPICWNPSAQDLGGLVIDGEVKAAAKAGVIENSFLQDLACKGCGQKLGIRVDSSPESHVLTKDQLILRVGGMSIFSDKTGQKGSLRIRRKFSLGTTQPRLRTSTKNTEPSISPTARPVEVVSLVTQERPAILPSNGEDPIPGLLEFAEWAKEAIVNQDRDIGRISGVVLKLEKDMKNLRDLMFETRKDLASVPTGRPWESMKTTVAFLENETRTLRTELDDKSSSANDAKDDNVKLTGEDIDMLTDSITRINQKVLEVDGLKMEIQFMKSRLKRFEETSKAARQTVDLTTETSSGQPQPLPYPTPYRSPAMLSQRRAASVSLPPNQCQVPSASTTDPESGSLQHLGTITRKRKRSDLGPEPMNTISNEREFSDSPAPATRPATTRKLSRLSNVQLIEEIPNPDASSSTMDRSLSLDGATSDPNDHPALEYDSAPEGGRPTTTRRSVLGQTQRETTTRVPSPDLSMPPPPLPTRSRPLPHTQADNLSGTGSTATREVLFDSSTTVTRSSRTRRRAASELPALSVLRNADGLRLTKKGEPDGRSQRYRHLRTPVERAKGEKQGDDEVREEVGDGHGGEGEGESQEKISKRAGSVSKGNRELENGHSRGSGRRHSKRILPSIEIGARSAGNKYGAPSSTHFVVEVEIDGKKKAALEARERLVRETLEREL